MRRPTLAALVALSLVLVSCADMPTAPLVRVGVSGTILDRDGNAMQAVYLLFVDLGPRAKGADPAEYFTVTNVEGKFSTSMPEGRYDLYIAPPAFRAYAPTTLRSLQIGPAGLRLDYRFDWRRIAIRPAISGGQPASALRAYIYFASDFSYFRDLRLAGSEREAFVPPGTYHVNLDLNGTGFGYPHQDLVASVSGDTTIDVAFSGNAVAIHVTGQGGLPLAGGRVVASSSPPPYAYAIALTDAGGAATLYLPSATYRLTAVAPSSDVMGRSLAGVSISGDASIDFDLSGVTWSGFVRRASDGSPVANASVHASIEDDSAPTAISITDADGAFHFVVQGERYHRLIAYELVGGDAWGEVARIDSVAAGADSTFDIIVNEPVAARFPTRFRPAPPGAPGAPASAAVGPSFRRRSSRTAE